ncbi:MAG TPA: orotate phosphoribosyltransferase [Chromatiales bacterium]|nr:orotate phosphoribosyltransferase [Thiotrichales bacterium]HIP68372.1 orotate phosphoribosyltransferase [Chromatiales bacterium]
MPENYKNEFLRLAIENEVLRFGEFTLKSGRVSPYFFNAGLFATGKAMALLGQYYAQAIIDSGLRFDVLFGPAYKGIPLAAVTAAALYEKHGLNIPWAYNRKEKKDHGEGGQLVGAPMQGKVLIIDDVITAGTAIREAVDMIEDTGAELGGVVIALDRQEKGQGALSAVQEVEHRFGVRVAKIAGLDDLMDFLAQDPSLSGFLEQMQAYRDTYAVNG